MRDETTFRGHMKAVATLGIPLIGGNLAQFMITMTDTVMLGWYDVHALAAQVLGGMVFFVLFIFGSGLAMAVMPAVAEAEAAQDDRRVRRVTRMGLWASLAFALASLPVFLLARPLLGVLGQEPGLIELAARYMEIAGFGIIFALLGMVLKSYLSALEHTGVVLWSSVAGALVNIVVNYALIFGNWGAPELGIRGAAIASLAVQALMFALLLAYVMRVVPRHRLFLRIWRVDGAALWLVLRLGTPIGLTNLAEVSLFAASSVMMGWLGTVPLAAHGIVLQVSSATFMIHLGLASAATVRAGRAVGRRDRPGLRRGAQVVFAASMGLALVSVVVFLSIPDVLIGFFLDPMDPARDAVLATGVVLLAAAALFQLVDAAQVMALGLLRGVQDTRVPMMIAALAYWVIGLPVSYVLGFGLGLGGVGVWLGLAAGLAVAAALLIWRFLRVDLSRVMPE